MKFKLIENGDSVRKHDRDVLKQVIFDLKDSDDDSFVIVEPKMPIENSIYLQVSLEEKLYRMEIRLLFGSDDNFKHYSQLVSSKEDVFEVFDKYYSDCKLPDLRSWSDDTSIFKEESEEDMVKLYKTIDGVIHYFEMWIDEDNQLTSHTGILGDVGNTEYFDEPNKAEDLLPARVAMAKAIKTYEDLGYNRDVHFTELIIQFPYDVKYKASEIAQEVENLEQVLNNCLGWTGNGHCDTADAEAGIISAFCYVVDKTIATDTILDALDEDGLAHDSLRIAYANEKTEEYELLYPNEGTFDIGRI